MNIIKLSPQHYNAWNEKATFWQSTDWIEYLLNSKFDTHFVNHSFFTEQNGQIIDIVPLIQQDNELYSPAFNDKKEILAEIYRIAQENNIKRIEVDSDIKSYLNISGYTTILYLNKINLSKGHKSAIKKAKKYLTYRQRYDIWDFKKDYFKIAGKETRPKITFDILQLLIDKGNGILLEARLNDETAGYIYLIIYKEYTYYFMSATFSEYKQYNVNHFLLYKSFDLLKRYEVQYIELGEQVTNSLHYQPTEKEFNINKFKKGFDNYKEIKPKSEYFFDQSYFEETMQKRIRNYIKAEYEGGKA